MKIRGAALACFPLLCLMAAPLMAQPQIGGGTCSSATLNGAYSLTLSGRDVNSSLVFTQVLQGIGTVTFDGQSQVVFSLTSNTNQSPGVAQTWSGTYSLQANCTGVVTLTTGETASFLLESFNGGKAYLIAGQDGTYTLTGNGSLTPASGCAASQLNGSYSFNGSGYALLSGAVSGANNISGLLQFDGMSAITANWSLASSGMSSFDNATGQYTVSPSCVGSATITDSGGNTWALQFAVTSPSGSNFIVSGASATGMFTGSGRTESTTAPCTVATLTGVRALTMTGRNLSLAGVLTATYLSNGYATFDGAGNVVLTLTATTNRSLDAPETLTGTYTLSSDCTGALNITKGDIASFTLVAYGAGESFTITGEDGTYALTGQGAQQPPFCSASTVSGTYAFSGNGNNNSLGLGTISGVNDISGLLHFDGRGDVTGSWSVATNQTAVPDTVTGQYSVTAGCLGNATVVDPSGSSWSLNFTVTSVDGSDIGVDIASVNSEFAASGHSTFTNPGLAVVNAASSVAGGTPPGSIFAVYGSGLATGSAQATRLPLPDSLLSTSVTVNGEDAPLFYAGDGQINAQMPLDIQPGVASVVVKNGLATSNTVAVTVPATAVPGIAIQYPTNQAVVQNQNLSENTPAAPAHVGNTVVAYFTGGGPVKAAAPLVTGSASPRGLSPVLESVQVTIGGVTSPSVTYTGLTATLVGVYQVNFVIPQVPPGDKTLILTINGTASAPTTISIAN